MNTVVHGQQIADSGGRSAHPSREPWEAKVVHDGTAVTARVWHDAGAGTWRWRVDVGNLPEAWGISPDEESAQTAAIGAAVRSLDGPPHLMTAESAS